MYTWNTHNVQMYVLTYEILYNGAKPFWNCILIFNQLQLYKIFPLHWYNSSKNMQICDSTSEKVLTQLCTFVWSSIRVIFLLNSSGIFFYSSHLKDLRACVCCNMRTFSGGLLTRASNIYTKNEREHRLRTPNEGINQIYLIYNWADEADKICFGRT